MRKVEKPPESNAAIEKTEYLKLLLESDRTELH